MTERILVVDDDEAVREIIAVMLGLAGYRCRPVANGVDALRLVDSGERFDLVTTDVHNAPMDGITFLEEMKKRSPESSVLMLTAVDEPSIASACRKKGACDVLLKPFKRGELLEVVHRALESCHSNPEA